MGGLPTVDAAALRSRDGSGGDVHLACLGLVFDVSSGISFYGPGGPYAALAGKDATVALAKHSLVAVDDSSGDVSSLTLKERIAAEGWAAKFKGKYPIVGRFLFQIPSQQRS